LLHSGLVWSGLVWSGLVWSGLVWSGLVVERGFENVSVQTAEAAHHHDTGIMSHDNSGLRDGEWR
jgi:hypothetical protein